MPRRNSNCAGKGTKEPKGPGEKDLDALRARFIKGWAKKQRETMKRQKYQEDQPKE